jgi:hypothetical protein
MAGDWIKMRTDLSEDPAVIAVAARLNIDEFSVVGRLHRIWSWADSQLRDGYAYGITLKWIDRYVHLDGFSNALLDVGWLGKIENETLPESGNIGLLEGNANLLDREEIEKGFEKIEKGVFFPNFDRHNGETAKTRAVKTKNKQNSRATNGQFALLEGDLLDGDKTGTREEKRREEKYNPQVAFSIFWKSYPRKDSKVPAEKAFAKVATSFEVFDAIMAGVERAKQYDQWRKDHGQFIPYASSWLNQRRWEDDIDEPTTHDNPFAEAL